MLLRMQSRIGAETVWWEISGDGEWNRFRENEETQGRGNAGLCREGRQSETEGRHKAWSYRNFEVVGEGCSSADT